MDSVGTKLKNRLKRIGEIQTTIPFPVIAGILIAALALEVLFVILAINLGILPGQYILLLIVLLVAIDVGLLALLTNHGRGKKRYYTGLVLTMLLMVMLLPGSYFLADADSALRHMLHEGEQWEEYDVIALKDSGYEAVGDIRGKTVYVLGSDTKMNVEAREKLVTKADVELDDSSASILSLGSRILDDKEQKHDELILVSESQYDLMCDEIDHFKKNTKSIYTVKVMKRSDNTSSRVNVTKDPFNIYITGIDIWGDINKVSRSDVNMIVTVNPQTREILLTSIPRDSYVPLHSFGALDKLTHSGIYGVDETLDTVTDWLGVDFDYYVKINFSMVVKLIDAMGGIVVYADQDFDSAISKYHYKKGKNYVGGKAALYFARERKSFEGSDEERVKNQQKVMKGLINKITTHKEILLNYRELLAIVSENMATNMTDRELTALARMQLKDMDTKWNVRTTKVSGEGAMREVFSMGTGREFFVSLPKEQSVEHVKEEIHNVMYPVETGESGVL